MEKLSLGVFASGRGSNFAAILDAIQQDRLNADVVFLLSNQSDAGALSIAREHDISTAVLNSKEFDTRERFVQTMLSLLKRHKVNFIALAGYLKKIPAEIVASYRNRIINIHPALLPSFGGKGMYGHHVHEAVLKCGCRVTGVTVHIVDEIYDCGPIVAQRCVSVEEGDTVETLAARVLQVEHLIYPEVLQWFAEGRVEVKDRHATVHTGG